MRLDRSPQIRRAALRVLSRVNPGDIVIRHHWTGDRVVLHSFKHRSYWYRGRQREQQSMTLLERVVAPSDTVIEAGGHIGYISLWLAYLAREGTCHVFEPSSSNLPYLRMNASAKPSIRVVAMAVGAEEGTAELHLDELTGQNSSLVQGFSGYRRSQRFAFTPTGDGRSEVVQVTTIDAYVEAHGLEPNVIKIDVEGFEAQAFEGARRTLERYQPIVMAEVHAYCATEIASIVLPLGYVALHEDGSRAQDATDLHGNVFFVPADRAIVLVEEMASVGG